MTIDRHRSRRPQQPAAPSPDPHPIKRHGAPAGAADDYDEYYDLTELSLGRPGKLLPAVMLSIIPALLLLCAGAMFHQQWLYVGATVLSLLLIVLSTVLIGLCGLIGAVEYSRRARHRPPRSHRH